MNPLFIAHLIGDFLLQPTWLVKWKKRAVAGVAIHALLHFAALVLLVLPRSFFEVAALLLLAAFHGVVDQGKIWYERQNGPSILPSAFPFLIDQFLHLGSILLIVKLIPFAAGPWQTPAGTGMFILLTFYSFAVAHFYLKGRRVITALSFLLFIVPALLLVSPLCSAP